MGKGFFISKAVGVVLIIVGAGALATIIALSVVYSQEKAKNNEVSPTHATTTTTSTGTTGTTGTTTGGPTTPPSNETWDKYRLPTTLKPDHYNLTLRPHLKPDPTTQIYHFTGSSSVEFICESETDLILIHSNKLIYYNQTNGQMASLKAVDPGHNAPSIKSTFLKTETQYLVIQLDGNLMAGQRYQLHTEFIGELADDLGGFYRSEYKENGETKVVATTQMQPTDARKAFPCFDEPAMKAVFYITLIHDINTTALSNGEQTVFKPTERMSTYLLAFIVSDFGYIQNSVDGVLVRIFARKSAIDAGQGQYALNKTGPILKFFEQYYNSSYPLPKSDQIALPDFNAGAMENWGLITYRETALLYDEEYSSNSNKERIATIIAHELAHMWFGNLVTLRWWNDLWLNEGFASYVEYLGADNAEPEWKLKDLIVLNDVHRVFAIDALTSSHPLSSREEDIQRPEQISELFDAISYSKGASVLRMLSDFLTEEVFQHGLQTYLKTFQFQNAVYTDLWHHLQMVRTSLNVSKIMNTWVLQMGYPVVTINTATGVVSQKHFLLDPDSEVTVKSEFKYVYLLKFFFSLSYVNDQQQHWLIYTMIFSSGDAWVLANHLVAGYYRVNYDDGNWNKLLNILNTNRLLIPEINRAQLIDDAFNLARAKIVRTELALETTKYLRMETDFMPWESALDNLDFFYLMFDRSEVYGYMQDYLRNQVTPLFNYYKTITENWSKVPTGHLDQYNQVNAITLACKTGHPECITLATTWFKDWMTTEQNKIHPNLRSTVYCNAIAAGGADEWEFAWKKFQNATIAIEADKLRYALSCTKQPWLLNRYLEYTLEPKLVRKQDATSTIVYIAGNVVGQPLAWDFVRARWEYIFNQYGGGSFSFSNLINGVTKRFSTEFELQQLEQFKKDNADVGFGSGTLALDQSMERTRSNIKWLAENQENVLTWFKTEAER
uniref:Aminopeptidase n=1 Tax=Sphaeramia orbicularis TaxID=375764 RepID=A0A672ZLD5_9TELE